MPKEPGLAVGALIAFMFGVAIGACVGWRIGSDVTFDDAYSLGKMDTIRELLAR